MRLLNKFNQKIKFDKMIETKRKEEKEKKRLKTGEDKKRKKERRGEKGTDG